MRLSVILLLFSLSLSGQGFRVRHYLPNTQTQLSKAIFETTPGSYITGGLIVEQVNNVTCNRLCIMGLDAQGQIVWTKKYGNSKFEYLDNNLVSKMFYKKDNFLYFVGCARDSNNFQQGVLIKFDGNGDTLWRRIYRDPDPLEDVIPQMVTMGVDGGFLITGFFQNNSNTRYSKCLLIKTDANGNEIWRKKIAKVVPNTQDGQAILQDAVTKKIVMVGYQYIGNANAWSIHDNVVITDSLGEQVNRFNYMGFGGVLKDVIQTADQKIVAVGYKYDPQTIGGYNLNRSFAVKFDIATPSTPIWELIHDKLTLANAFSCIIELPNGEIVIGGGIDTMQIINLNPNTFVRLTKVSTTGSVMWNRNYNYKINSPTSDNNLGLRSINLASGGSLIGAIEVANFPGPNPFFFVKFDSTGCDSTLAYCQSQGTVSGSYENKFNEAQVNIFPSPASEYITAVVSNLDSQNLLEISILDLSGREVKTSRLTGEKNLLGIKDLSNGVYFVRVTSNQGLLYTAKLVKQE